jgi:hypothetical protein
MAHLQTAQRAQRGAGKHGNHDDRQTGTTLPSSICTGAFSQRFSPPSISSSITLTT